MIALQTLGQRIVILGPSNAGKSTLAEAIFRRLDLPVVHLDQLRFLPNTDWQERPDADFAALHQAAVMQERWVMEGNYSALFPERLERASAIIVIDANRWLRLYRYLKRTLITRSGRIGHLAGVKDGVSWEMVKWVFFESTNPATKYPNLTEKTDKPVVHCHSRKELLELYRRWELTRPDRS